MWEFEDKSLYLQRQLMLWALLGECKYLNFINNLSTVIYHEQFEFDPLSGFGSSLCYYCFLLSSQASS